MASDQHDKSLQGFQIVKKVAGGNCKVAGTLSHCDNGSLVEEGAREEHPPSAQVNGALTPENFESQGALKFIPVHFLHP